MPVRNGVAFPLGLAITAIFFALPCLAQQDVVGEDGCVVKPVFEADWRKYSDFDPRIPPESQSWPVQQYAATTEEIKGCELEIVRLKARMELDRQWRLAAKDLEQSLKTGLKANLLRSFWRLAWVTYSTIGGATGRTELVSAGKAYAELFTEEITSLVEPAAKVLGAAKKLVPKQYSKLPGREGQVVNVGVDAVIAGMQNLSKPTVEMVVKGAMDGLETGGNEVLGDADITPQEMDILRRQYLQQQKLKTAISESYKVNSERQAQIEALETQIRSAREKEKEWEAAEKRRVFAKLNDKCQAASSLQFAITAPNRVAPGEVALVRLKLPPGRRVTDFLYNWYTKDQSNFSFQVTDNIHFQSLIKGEHVVNVDIYQGRDQHYVEYVGKLSTVITVAEPPPPTAPTAASAGVVQVRISKVEVRPAVLIPGDRLEVNATFNVSGLPKDRKVPVVIHYVYGLAGQKLERVVNGDVVNGEFNGQDVNATAGWMAGRYSVDVSVDVMGGRASAAGSFVVRQPDVATAAPPPLPTQPSTTNARDFVGDWAGTGTVIQASGIEGFRPGEHTPMKVRITRQGDVYHVYDLLDPNTPMAPLRSRVEGGSVVFSYSGPMIDTQGYAHEDMPMTVSWTLTLIGGDLAGDFVFGMSGGGATIHVQATRAQ